MLLDAEPDVRGVNDVAQIDPGDVRKHRLARTVAVDPGPRHDVPAKLDFRLHPEMGALRDLYQSDRIALVHASGIANGTRSHFGAQELIERGIGAPDETGRVSGGWMARWLAARHPTRVDIDWDSTDPTLLGPLLRRLHPYFAEDLLVEANIPYMDWFRSAKKGRGTDLQWLISRIEKFPILHKADH